MKKYVLDSTDIKKNICKTWQLYKKCFNWEKLDRIPMQVVSPPFTALGKAKVPNVREQFQYPATMFEAEMQRVNTNLQIPSDYIPCIWGQYGEALIPSMFGADITINDDTSPWIHPLLKDVSEIDSLKRPDFSAGMFPAAKRTLRYFLDNAPEYVSVNTPSFMTPFETAYMLRGSDFFIDLLRKPDKAHKLIEICTDIIITCFSELNSMRLQREQEGYIDGLGVWAPGPTIGGDVCVNVSRSIIEEFDVPYIERFSKAVDTNVVIHFCSVGHLTGKQVFEAYAYCPCIVAINSHLMYHVYKDCQKTAQLEGKCILLGVGPDPDSDPDNRIGPNNIEHIAAILNHRHMETPRGFSLGVLAKKLPEGKEIWSKWCLQWQ
ncbi:MAG: uroporphyrinogen decarboxylase family protein [Planctomycetota bacterium]